MKNLYFIIITLLFTFNLNANNNLGTEETTVDKTLNLTAYLEGFFNGYNMNPAYNAYGEQWGMNIADKITIELRNSITPSVIEATFADINLLTNGTCSITVPSTLNNSYYIVIKNRNSIQTWSSVPVSFAGSTISYNFTTSASQAYGNNLQQFSSSVYLIYSGDVNQDEMIDITDFINVLNDNNNFSFGFFTTDVNGDGLVDGSDCQIIKDKISLGLFVKKP